MTVATHQAQRDSQIEGITYPNTNYGTADPLALGAIYAGGTKTLLYRSIGNFDVSSLSGATINSAKLVRYIANAAYGNFAAKLTRCTRPSTWTENGVTWLKWDGANNWSAPGGDLDDATPGVVNYTEPAATGPHEITGLAAYVTDALANRSGLVSIILRATDEAPTVSKWVTFRSKEYGTPAERWYLEVDYTLPPPIRPRRDILAPGQGASRPRAARRPTPGRRPTRPGRASKGRTP
jgi:hypothetical protein